MGIITTIFGVLKYWKWIVGALAAMALMFAFHQYKSAIQEAAAQKVVIDVLEQENKKHAEAIELLKKDMELSNQIVKERDEELRNLEDKYVDLLSNLPTDSKDVAPESIRETLKRLNGKK